MLVVKLNLVKKYFHFLNFLGLVKKWEGSSDLLTLTL